MSAALPEDRIGESRILPSEGGRDIHELREHGDADACADGERASIEVALDDDVVESLHSGLAGGGKTRNANDSGESCAASAPWAYSENIVSSA